MDNANDTEGGLISLQADLNTVLNKEEGKYIILMVISLITYLNVLV